MVVYILDMNRRNIHANTQKAINLSMGLFLFKVPENKYLRMPQSNIS